MNTEERMKSIRFLANFNRDISMAKSMDQIYQLHLKARFTSLNPKSVILLLRNVTTLLSREPYFDQGKIREIVEMCFEHMLGTHH